MPIVYCWNCKKRMEVTQKRLDDGRGRFCSRSCVSIYYHTGRPKPKSRENQKIAVLAIKGKPAPNRKPYFKKICPICNTTFEVPQRRKDKAKYCSRACSHEAKRRVFGPGHPLWTRVKRTCEWCGKEVWVKPAKLHEFRFCSQRCVWTYIAKQAAEKNGPTDIELLLMDELNQRDIEYKTQHKIAHWLIDITIPVHRVAIEADGNYWHSSPEQQEKDRNKDRWLKAHKWTIFRFSGSEIRQSPEACIDKVVDHIESLRNDR